MPLSVGTRLGPYEITGPVGAGGMGEVYRARDTRLDRDVAIKILPAALAADPSLRERFEREAKAVAAISHPNILAIHDVGHERVPLERGREEVIAFAVMELLDGETLRERLLAAAPHGLPVRKSIDCALQIARGLAAAHQKSIVHRDLKPENVFVTADGRVKILDFGLAKQQSGAVSGATITPTHVQATTPGTILGTVGYMAPEQVRGLTVDQRVDIFALGAILYEMVSGRRAFAGATPADAMSAVLHQDPPPLPETDASLPPALDRIVRRCLEKHVDERFSSAHDFALALEALSGTSGGAGSSPSIAAPPAAVSPVRWRTMGLAAGLLAVGIGIGAGVTLFRPSPAARPPLHLAVLPPDKVDVIESLALSPDGETVAFIGIDAESIVRLWIRRLDAAAARVLPGTEGGTSPFWSPDGRSLGFFAQGKLKRIDIAGGPPRVLAPVTDPRGGTWNAEGVIVFAPHPGDGLYRIAAIGGDATPLTKLDAARQDVSHRWPTFLPDGRHVLFMNRVGARDDRLAIYAIALDNPARPSRVVTADSTGHYMNGRLYFLRGTTLFAQPFDLRGLQLSGDVEPVAEQVWQDPNTDGLIGFAATSGVLAFRPANAANTRFTWFDRSGKPLGPVGPPAAADPTLSPDGRSLAFDRAEATGSGFSSGLWTIDLERGTTTRVLPTPQNDVNPVWTADGSRMAFTSDRAGSFDLYEKPAAQPERAILKSPLWKFPESYSPDGRLLLFSQLDPKSRLDLLVIPVGGGAAAAFAKTDADEYAGRFSPDGRWVAYASNESGREEIYVSSFPPTGARVQISADGGTLPLWRRDGQELYYISTDHFIMTVAVRSQGATFQASVPQSLFQVRMKQQAVRAGDDRMYSVSARGDRFVISQLTSDVRASAINVIIGARER